MERQSFRERNRQRREQNAFENLYGYAREAGVPDPKRTAERTARSIHGDAPAPRARRAPAPDERAVPHRLEDRSRDQLYARAQELDIAGRSQMTKDELIAAIRAQS